MEPLGTLNGALSFSGVLSVKRLERSLMAESGTAIGRSGFGATMRRDAWWANLIPVVLVLGAFSIYATWRTFENGYYEFGPYLSPFYSPLIKPKWWPLSPAILILWAPLGFRATCYYY